MTMTLDEVALANLKVLNEEQSDETKFILMASGNVLSVIEDDNYDTISSVKDLEYPIYFTYHHIFNILLYDTSISYYVRKFLLEQIERSFDNLGDYIDVAQLMSEADKVSDIHSLMMIQDDITDKYDIVRERVMYKRCYPVVNLFDHLVEACRYASTCLYFNPYDFQLKRTAIYEGGVGEEVGEEGDTSDDEKFEDGNFDEIEFEGISYLEDNRFQKIYNKEHKHIGAFNDNHDDIIWANDECMMDHESLKVKLD